MEEASEPARSSSPGSADQQQQQHSDDLRATSTQGCEEPCQSAASAMAGSSSSAPAKRLKFALRSTSSVEETERRYCVRFEGNRSKKWDGRQIMLESEWLESLYSRDDLCPGKIVELPWEEKGAGCVKWKAVIVDLAAGE